MTRTRSMLGALIVSALAVCAFGALNASALTMHECTATAEGTGKHYKDASCAEESTEGTFRTVPLPAGKEVELEGTLTPTTAGMNVTSGEVSGTHLLLHFKVGALEVQITCTAFSSPGAKVKNVEEIKGVTGTTKVKVSNCLIVAGELTAANCQVAEAMETVELSVTTEEDQVIFKPISGTTVFKMPFTSRPGKTCPIAGEKNVTGTLKGTAASPTALEFTNSSGSELGFIDPKLGAVTLQFTAVTHFKTKGGPLEEGRVAIVTP